MFLQREALMINLKYALYILFCLLLTHVSVDAVVIINQAKYPIVIRYTSFLNNKDLPAQMCILGGKSSVVHEDGKSCVIIAINLKQRYMFDDLTSGTVIFFNPETKYRGMHTWRVDSKL